MPVTYFAILAHMDRLKSGLLYQLYRALLTLAVLVWSFQGLKAQEADTCFGPLPSAKIPNIRLDTLGGLVPLEREVRAGLLYDAEKGVVVWEKDMYYAYPIASLTKMMVALLVAEDVRACRADWSDEVVVERSYRKSRHNRKVYRTTETYTLESLVQLAMIPSNNLACEDIAKHLGGTVANFVQRMNEKALSLGMKNTFYSNPSGLPGVVKEVDNSASPHDLLLLSLEMIRYEELLRITSIGYAEISNDKRSGVYRNHNHLVINYENEVDGLKTGFTKRARFCLAASAKKEGYRLISIVLGVDGPYLRNEIVADMINSYYEQIGCGPMNPSTGGPVARKTLVSDPASLEAEASGNVTYKTMWVKERRVHTVRSGESLSSIAQKYGSTYQQVKKWNRLSSNRILKGQKLYVYVSVPKKVAIPNPDVLDNEDETITTDDDGALQVTDRKPGSDSSVVQMADSVTLPGEDSNQVSAAPVKKLQPATAKKAIAVTDNKAAPKQYVYHVVQPGDTLWGIAQRYKGISVDEIKRTNNIYNSKGLKPGTRLKIKVKGQS
jgi:D-alanyl-D-alanine carboxypeptidase (penicillin-binding protein 5/6)